MVKVVESVWSIIGSMAEDFLVLDDSQWTDGTCIKKKLGSRAVFAHRFGGSEFLGASGKSRWAEGYSSLVFRVQGLGV